MTQARMLMASAAAIALTLGVTGQTPAPKETPLSTSDIVIAADDGTAADSTADTADDTDPAAGLTEENAEGSAKMGDEEGTHEGANLGAPPENDTSKIDQPARRNPTTGNAPHG